MDEMKTPDSTNDQPNRTFTMQLPSDSKNLAVGFILILLSFTCSEGLSQSPDSAITNDPAREVRQNDPNLEPYSSGKSPVEHLLALPSYLLHWTTRPIGWGIKFAERKLPQLLEGERGPYGVYPLFELGGDAGSAYGFLAYHNKFLKYNHKVRIQALFGSEEFNDFDLEYAIPNISGNNSKLEFDISYFNDPVKSFFGGNDATRADEQLYATEEFEGVMEYSRSLTSAAQISFSGRYRIIEVAESEFIIEDPLPLVPETLQGTTSLFSLGSVVRFNFAEGAPRSVRGSRYIFALDWHRSFTDDRFHYLRYSLEWQKFFPLGFVPDSRRLAFRSKLIKTEAFHDKQIPFFNLPDLGSSRDLRGFSSDRFRDTGSLLLTLEYRYPVWAFADVVLFVDEGQVFDRYSDIAINDFHTSYGFGFHMLSAKSFAFRAEFAFSRETSRVILSINPNF